jgi:DNA-binding MarR family transcriptional regulator
METLQEPGSCSKVPAPLREGLGWLLARIAHGFRVAHDEALAPHGLTMRSFAVLAMAGGGAARTQLEIAQGVGLDKTTLVATLDELERRELVRRKPDDQDRRARIVTITPQGEQLLALGAEAVRTIEAALLANLPPEYAEETKSAMFAVMGGPLHDYLDRAGSCV